MLNLGKLHRREKDEMGWDKFEMYCNPSFEVVDMGLHYIDGV